MAYTVCATHGVREVSSKGVLGLSLATGLHGLSIWYLVFQAEIRV